MSYIKLKKTPFLLCLPNNLIGYRFYTKKATDEVQPIAYFHLFI